MSGKAVGWAFEVPDLTPTQRLVLVAVADNATSEGECWPGQRHLAAKTGLGATTVRKALKHLEGAGLLARTPRQRVDGRGRTSDLFQLAIGDQPAAGAGGQPAAEDATNRQLTTDQPAPREGQGTVREPSVEPKDKHRGDNGASGRAEPGNDTEWAEWLAHYRETTGRPARGSASARRKFRARRQGSAEEQPLSLADLKAATAGAHGDAWVRARGFDVPDTILRSANVDRYVALAKSERAPDRSSGSIASIRRDDEDYGATLETARPRADTDDGDNGNETGLKARAQGAQGGR